MAKRLYRSEKNRIIGGVCGGLGDYFDIDPTLLRLIWVVLTVLTGFVPGALIYVLAMLIMPVKR